MTGFISSQFTFDAPALLMATDWPVVVAIFTFIYGASIGSFANAAALRLLLDEDPISQPSRCRFCNRNLRAFENLPIVGYLILMGKCGCKKHPLPARYVAVELGTAILFCIYAAILPFWACLALSIALAIMIIAFLTDFSGMVLWTPSLGLGAFFGFAASLLIPEWPVAPASAVFGAALGASFIILINFAYKIMRGVNGFGSGDIWLMAMIGAWFGPIGAVITFFGGAYLGALVGITLILLGKKHISSKLPFGVFLSIVFLLYPISYI